MTEINNLTIKFEKKTRSFSRNYSGDKVAAKLYRLLIDQNVEEEALTQLKELYLDLVFVNDMNSLLIEKISKVLSSSKEVNGV